MLNALKGFVSRNDETFKEYLQKTFNYENACFDSEMPENISRELSSRPSFSTKLLFLLTKEVLLPVLSLSFLKEHVKI